MVETRRPIAAALLVALTVSLGYLLAAVPNVELMTISLFLSGYLLGPALGAGVALGSALLYGLLNPLGPALPPLLAAQALGFVAAALGGAALGPLLAGLSSRARAAALAGFCGFGLTAFYDLATNLASYYLVTAGESSLGLGTFLVGGGVFMVVHLLWNTALFSTAAAPALRVLARRRWELRGGAGR